MVDQLKSWFKENSTLVYFLIGQAVAVGAGAVSLLAYMVQLEHRVHTAETRGSPYVAERLNKMDHQLAVLETATKSNKDSIDRIVNLLTRDGSKYRLQSDQEESRPFEFKNK